MHPEPLNSDGNERAGHDEDTQAGATREPLAAATGDARVDAAVAGLAALDDLELADRPAVLEAVHDRLREILGELGDAGRPTHSGHGHSGQGHSGQGLSGQALSGQGLSGQGYSGQAHSAQGADPRQGHGAEASASEASASEASASEASASGDRASGDRASGDRDPRP